jgi:uncharacterized membrane protein YhaH (DUF805 family)
MSYYGRKSSGYFLMEVVISIGVSIVVLVKYPEWFGALAVLGLGVFLFLRWQKPKGYLTHLPEVKVSSLRRMRRGTFFLWSLGLGLVSALPVALTQKDPSEEVRLMGQVATGVLYGLMSIGINRKRLHDFGKSGWWTLLQFIPGVGFGLWFYLVLTKGDYGMNGYGYDPRGATEEIIVGPYPPNTDPNLVLDSYPVGTVIRR